MRSSYKRNNYGDLFSALVTIYKPKVIVECGVLDGYSLLHMAIAAQRKSTIYAYDLFENYQFKHGKREEIQAMLYANFFDNVVLSNDDAFIAAKFFADKSIDMLHIDVSNDGTKLKHMFEAWSPKIKKNGLVLFEGGSKSRDRVKWMIKYKKTTIGYFKWFLEKLGYEYVTLTPYPSITICRKR